MITVDHIRQAVNLSGFDPTIAHEQMSPIPRGAPGDLRSNWQGKPVRQAGVLILIYPDIAGFHLVLTRRTETLRGHSGQISFPGGSRDLEDSTFTDTALRETCEELGICEEDITVIGSLSQIYIPPSHFDVFPSVGTLDHIPHFSPNPDEVAEVFSFTLDDLLHPDSKQTEWREIQGHSIHVPYYRVREHKVWGATAIMLSELEARLRAVLPEPLMQMLEM